MGIINQDFFDKTTLKMLRERFATAEPFPHVAFEGFLEPDFMERISAGFPSHEAVSAKGTNFRAEDEQGKAALSDLSSLPDEFSELRRALHAPSFLDALETVTGISGLTVDESLTGGGIHCTCPEGYLKVHADFNVLGSSMYRMLNLILFCNPDWSEEWGGELELWTPAMDAVASYPVSQNRMVVFLTNDATPHGARQVKGPNDRQSFAVYYYTKTPPPWYQGNHSTLFFERPDGSL